MGSGWLERIKDLCRCSRQRSGGQARMVKNFSHCARFQDGGDDFQGSPAMWAKPNVNIEHPLERTEAEEGGTVSFVQDGLLLFFLLPRIISERSCQSLHEFQRRHDDMRSAIPIRRF